MVRRLTTTAVAVAVLALAGSGCGGYGGGGMATTSGQSVLAGHWKGKLHQRGLSPFVVTATIASPAGSTGNTVHYTGIDCSGHWTYLRSEGSAYRFREVITRGSGGKCKGVGVVTLTTESSAADRLGYEFRGGGVVSPGTLHRVS